LLPARNPRGHEDLVRNPVQLVLDGAVTLSVRGARGGPDVLLVAVGLSGGRSEGRSEPNSACDSGGTNRRQNLLQDVPFQWFAGALSASDVALIVALQVDPELGRRAEVPSEPQRRVCGDPPLAVHDLIDPPGRDADRHGELVLRDAEAPDEVLPADFARVNRLDTVSGGQRLAPPEAQRRAPERLNALYGRMRGLFGPKFGIRPMFTTQKAVHKPRSA